MALGPRAREARERRGFYSGTGEMQFKSRGAGRGRKTGSGSLSRVVNKLLAKSDPQCLQPNNSICDNNPIPKSTTTTPLPSPVINKLKKLGTSVVPEINGQTPEAIPTGYLQLMETLNKAVGLTSDLTKKKKRRSPKKPPNQVPSTVQLLAEIDGSENLAKFTFQVDAKQVIELPEGQKLYTCDICSGVYHRGFSLKRHYLKTHINYKHISKRDLHNCGILSDPSVEKGGANKKKLIKNDSPPIVSNLSPPSDIPDLYRCHTCFMCFMLISDLKSHLMEHPPVSVQNLAEDPFKSYSCPNCKARYQKKKLFLRHKEMCGVVEPDVTGGHNCLYCDKSFTTLVLRKKHHLQMHHPKKKLHQCFLCKTKMFKERLGLFKHLILHHPDEYTGCLSCKLRFGNRDEFKRHNKETHKTLGTAKKLLIQQKITAKNPGEVSKPESCPEVEQPSDKTASTSSNPNLVIRCPECPKMFASHLNMSRHRRLAHRLMKQKKKKLMQEKKLKIPEKLDNRKSPTPPPAVIPPSSVPQTPPPLDPEVLFYSTIAHNIRENLTHHLDGKLDSQEVMEYDLNKATSVRNKVLNFSASFTSENAGSLAVVNDAPSTPVQQKESRSTPISPRGQWEKFNFPKNYDGRCGLTSYIKDMSHLDISTQLTMRRNLQRLNSMAGQERNKESPASIPAGLLLVEKPGLDCAETFGDPNENKSKGGSEPVLSGEWVRPRTFLCAACGYKSTNLWDTEDHKYALHPNVWVPHVEIVAEESEAWDWFYHRRLPPSTVVLETTPAAPMEPPPCSKCSRVCHSMPDLHRHMLDCGGDTTWMATMLAVTSPGARRRKWRPFGSRRRRTTGRRGLKRNIPNTPAKHSCGRIRTKPGDMDTIQKMIANLPPKRASRKVIGEEPDIKTRSQSTISSVPISSVAAYSSSARSSGLKSAKFGKGSNKITQKKGKGDNSGQSEDKSRSKDKRETVKEEPLDSVTIKEEELSDIEMQPLEAENTIQHSDILTSLQMIRVVRKSPVTVISESQSERPIETSKIIAAMREAMLDSDEKMDEEPSERKFVEQPKEKKPVEKVKERKSVEKPKEKKKKKKSQIEKLPEQPVQTNKSDSRNEDVIICNGCGMQFDSSSACQRHKKKCVYWKEERSTGEVKTNKCTQCGSEFPYLMALLKHDCNRSLDNPEEPSMPELCPVKPVEEVQFDTGEEIPILSPIDTARDEINTKRLSLMENTIREVGEEAFDVSGYFGKYFNNSFDSTTIKKEKDLIETESLKNEHNVNPKNTNKLENNREKQVLSQNKSEESEIRKESVIEDFKSTKQSHNVKIFKSKVKKQVCKNKKMSEIFKEVKKRGRKRKIKVKFHQKVLSSKSGLRKVGTSGPIAKSKTKAIQKKQRSTNFLMLMKEWEKLQKEGAVAVGKRKKVLSNGNSYVNERQYRSRRRMTSMVSNPDYGETESVTTDTSSVYEQLPSRPRRSRRCNSVATMNDIPCEMLKDLAESCLSVSSEDLKELNTGTLSQTVVEGNKKSLEDDIKVTGNNKESLDLDPQIIGKLSESITEPVVKKKPGRPRFKSITIETEQHIFEAIDTIIKRSSLSSNDVFIENDNRLVDNDRETKETKVPTDQSRDKSNVDKNVSDVKKDKMEFSSSPKQNVVNKKELECAELKQQNEKHTKEESVKTITNDTHQLNILPKKNILNEEQDIILTKSLGCKEDRITEIIDHVLNENKVENVTQNEGNIWKNIGQVIYNVSVGNADIFKEKNNLGNNITNSCDVIGKRKKKRRRGKGFRRLVRCSQDVSDGKLQDHPDPLALLAELDAKSKKRPGDANFTFIKKEFPNTSNSSDKTNNDIPCEKPLQLSVKGGKRMLVYSGDDNVTFKPKEIKTKQLSIADYLSISSFVKKSNGESKSQDNLMKEEKSSPTDKNACGLNKNEKIEDVLPSEITETTLAYQLPSISEMSKTIENIIKKNPDTLTISTDMENEDLCDKLCSPVSSSSKEDVALSVIREKVIQKKKKKLKLKKLAKNKHIEIMDNKICKTVKPKIPVKVEKIFPKDQKFTRGKKKVKVGVSRNRWEVSVIDDKSKPVELIYEGDSKSIPTPSTSSNEPVKKFYCSNCDEKFESSYDLYEHQLSPEHIMKTNETEPESNACEENDPVKFCKSIGNIINDLGKHTLNVANLMQHLKQRESVEEPVAEPVGNSNVAVGSACAVITPKEEWPSRSNTPLWDTNQQAWEVDSFSTNCSSSLGSIMDTVNKLLSSETEASPAAGYSWADLQLAMGASDEEMAMLEQLGEHSLQEDYVYDNSRPTVEWPSLMDLDQPDTAAVVPQTATTPPSTECVPAPLPPVRKQEPLSDSEDSKCRGLAVAGPGLSRQLLVDYEGRVMVCPTCSKHFMGLPALQTHVAWAHQNNTSKALKRRALHTVEDVDRRLVCFVCKEIVATASQLETHIQFMHTKRGDDQQANKSSLSESAERLKSKMSLALGGLVDKALNKLLGTTGRSPNEPATASVNAANPLQADVNSGALQLLGRLCAARKRTGNDSAKMGSDMMQLLSKLRAMSQKEDRAYHEMRSVLSRGRPGVSKGALQASVNSNSTTSPPPVPPAAQSPELKPTNLLDHLAVCSPDVQQRPYVCPICDLRFLIPSTRNRHIARAHGKYGQRYDEMADGQQGQDDFDYGWKDSLDLNVPDDDSGALLPLCSDCGLSFQSIHEVMQHRIEDHPRRFSADCPQEGKSDVIQNLPVVESSSETKLTAEPSQSDLVKLLPLSDNAIDSTSTSNNASKSSNDIKAGKKRKLVKTKNTHSQSKYQRKKRLHFEEKDEAKEADVSGNASDSSESSVDEADRRVSITPSPDQTETSPDKLSERSSEENLVELSRKLDRRKVRMGNMAEEAVRVKAEAALRELNLSRKNKSPSALAKWGINAIKFTKQDSKGTSSNLVTNSCPTKPKFASLIEKKWKMPAQAVIEQLQSPKKDESKSDVYDFEDEDHDSNRRPLHQLKDSSPDAEHSESNKLTTTVNISKSPRKAHHSSKMCTDSS